MRQERDSSAGQNAANTPVSTVSFEEAQAILRQHGLRVSESDVEVVMLVALHGAFHHQTQKLLDRHNAVLTTVMGKSVQTLHESLERAQMDFASAVRSVALENVTALISQHQKDMAVLTVQIRQAAWIAVGGVVFGVASLAIGMGVLLWIR